MSYIVRVYDPSNRVVIVDDQQYSEEEMNLFLYDYGMDLATRARLINKVKAVGIVEKIFQTPERLHLEFTLMTKT